jgi:hypothetical protein
MKVIIIYPNNFSLEHIKKNEYDIDFIKSNLDIFNYNDFKEQINKYIKIIDVESDQYFMDNIMTEILNDNELMDLVKNSDNLWGDTKLCLDYENIRYDIIFIDSNILNGKIKENHLGSLLTHEQLGLFGPCILMATEFSINNNKIIDCTINDLFKILVNKMVNKGIMIKENEIKDIYVSSKKNILNKVLVTDFIDYFSYEVNGFTYLCYYNSKSKKYLNIIGSIFFKRTLYDDIIILMEDKNITIDFNLDIFEKSFLINNLNFTENEKVSNYQTFQNIFQKNVNNISKCICNKTSDLFCSICYNKSYCSIECQTKDWDNHQKQCS